LSFSSTVQRYKAEAPRTPSAPVRDDRRLGTVPNGANDSSSSASVVSKERFPTKSFIYKKTICANAAAQPFPGIGYQITNEEVLTDDPPCYEQKTNDRRGLIWYPQKIKEKS
jgi:hypothetical protein